MEKGDNRCATCGFLSIVADTKNPNYSIPATWIEASEWARETGNLCSAKDSTYVVDNYRVDASPGCVRGAFRIDGEYGEQLEAETDPDKPLPSRTAIALRVIQRDRGCDKWVRYRPGFSPKEHLMIRMFEDLEIHRRDWEASQEKERRAWIDARETQNAAREDTENSRILWLTIVGVALAAFSLLSASSDSPLGKMIGPVVRIAWPEYGVLPSEASQR